MWQWLHTRMEVERSQLKTQTGIEIYAIFLDYKTHKPIKLARAKTIAKVVRMMFYDLVSEINK
jgi:hypothetical protein